MIRKRYDQESGGNGRYRRAPGRSTRFGFVRFKNAKAGFLDSVSATLSVPAGDGRLTGGPGQEHRLAGQHLDREGYSVQATAPVTGFRTLAGGEGFDETATARGRSSSMRDVRARPTFGCTQYRTAGLVGSRRRLFRTS